MSCQGQEVAKAIVSTESAEQNLVSWQQREQERLSSLEQSVEEVQLTCTSC